VTAESMAEGEDRRRASTLHGTCIALDGIGVLLTGPSGAGKSDLALRLIGAGALLVADDYTLIEDHGGRLSARPPAAIAGLIEVRGVGILRLPVAPLPVPLRVVIALVGAADVPRLPARESTVVLGVAMPLFRLAPFESSAVLKVQLAARLATGAIRAAG
jgi:HPr kinase/phosphorylase